MVQVAPHCRNALRIRVTLPVLLLLVAASGAAHAQRPAFDVLEASVAELQAALASGRVTSVALVDAYLARIAAYDRNGPQLNAIVHVSPHARTEAAARDAERARGTVRGPLHGIPILLKDNFNTADMPTTGASLALAGHVPPSDAFQTKKLRDGGAIILGKTNLHELAAGIVTISSLGGQTRNPYDPQRNPGGSSGGTGAAIASSFAALGWGTDTCGSIRIPAAHNALFGLRPTKGLSSISGIIPLSAIWPLASTRRSASTRRTPQRTPCAAARSRSRPHCARMRCAVRASVCSPRTSARTAMIVKQPTSCVPLSSA
jgi:amidase